MKQIERFLPEPQSASWHFYIQKIFANAPVFYRLFYIFAEKSCRIEYNNNITGFSSEKPD